MDHAKRAFRQEVIIAQNDDGTPVTITVAGETMDELCTRIAQVHEQFGLLPHQNDTLIPKRRGNHRSSVLFREYAENWFTTYKMGTKPTTQIDYKYILSRHLYPAFDCILLNDITTDDIQKLLNVRKDIARSTVNKIMITLDQIFRSAVKDGIISESPVDRDRIYNPSKKIQTRDALSEDQLRDILNHLHLLNWQDRRMLALLAFTGMRRGEVLGLRWEDIDLNNEVIHVRRNISYPINAPYVDTPKTKAGVRDIPLDSRLLNHLMPM